jgi:hypothetical protein
LVRDLPEELAVEEIVVPRREDVMQFRWVAIIALWTFLTGPIFSGPWLQSSPKPTPAKTILVKSHK